MNTNNNNNNQNSPEMNAFNYYTNYFLSTDTGRKIVKDIYGDTDIGTGLLKHADMHQKIMGKHFNKHSGPVAKFMFQQFEEPQQNTQQVALNSQDQGVMPSQSTPMQAPGRGMQIPSALRPPFKPMQS
jgi:hypothetical protein